MDNFLHKKYTVFSQHHGNWQELSESFARNVDHGNDCSKYPLFLDHASTRKTVRFNNKSFSSKQRPFLQNTRRKVCAKYSSGITLLKPLLCELCSYRTSRSGDLKKHMQCVHSETRNFACNFCGQMFKMSSSLYRHERNTCVKRREIL